MAEPRQQSRSGSKDFEQPQRIQRETGERSALTRQTPSGIGNRFSDPFAMMHALHREMDRMFENFGFGGSLMHSPFAGRDLERSLWSPEVEVYEKDGKLHVCADLPGLDKKEVNVAINDNFLTIEGERRSERNEEGWSERSYGRFSRTIPLPEGINSENANAKFENGVLDITFDAPRHQEQRGKRIEVR